MHDDLGWKQRIRKEERSKALHAVRLAESLAKQDGVPEASPRVGQGRGPVTPRRPAPQQLAALGRLPSFPAGHGDGSANMAGPAHGRSRQQEHLRRRRPLSVRSLAASRAYDVDSSQGRPRHHSSSGGRQADQVHASTEPKQPMNIAVDENLDLVDEVRGRHARIPRRFWDHHGATHYSV